MMRTKALAFLLGSLIAGGCMDALPLAGGDSPPDRAQSSFDQPEREARSEILDTLLARRSVVPAETTLGEVAGVALASSTRTAAAELRTAKLRAEAENRNWLPTIGPAVSLTSLGDVVAEILIEQVLFDNGRKKAERAYAAADVDVAAVALSQDMNERTFAAQTLYLQALRGQDTARLGDRALDRMAGFRRIVEGRVEGGVSDMGDLRMVDSKIATLRTMRETSADAARTALSELQAMTGHGFAPRPATPREVAVPVGVAPLNVLKAEAESGRAVARATAERAGYLPGATLTGTLASNGSGGALDIATGNALGLGTPAQLKAIEAGKETAARRVALAREEAARAEARLRGEIESLRRQQAEAERLARAGVETFRLFEAQFRAGQRVVLEVVDIYEQAVRREREAIDAQYDRLLAQLELARDLGLLADGDAI